LAYATLWAGWSALTLFAGRQPLCTQFAEAVHAPLTQQQEIYTRQITVAWSLYFAAMASASTLLFFLAPWTAWSFFDNFPTLPPIALMFIAKYWVRRKVLPDIQHAHILDAERAFRNSTVLPANR